MVRIPDEFQVNDDLYAELTQDAAAGTHERDYPQKRIGAFCAEHKIELLDLLPALREGERQARTYHLRDTHWNAHGNAIAGRELARCLAELLKERHR